MVGVITAYFYEFATAPDCQTELFYDRTEYPGVMAWVPSVMDWIINVTGLK